MLRPGALVQHLVELVPVRLQPVTRAHLLVEVRLPKVRLVLMAAGRAPRPGEVKPLLQAAVPLAALRAPQRVRPAMLCAPRKRGAVSPPRGLLMKRLTTTREAGHESGHRDPEGHVWQPHAA